VLDAYTAFDVTSRPATGPDPSIVSYTPTNLLNGLSINNFGGYWNITGTPTATTAAAGELVTIFATNSNGLVGSNTILVKISNATVNVTPNTSQIQSFIVGRSLSNAYTYLIGSTPYSYSYPLAYAITSPAYASTGWLSSNSLSFTNLPIGLTYVLTEVGSGYQVTLLGTPTIATSLSTLTLTVNIPTVASGSGSFQQRVNADTFTFTADTPTPFVFLQNISNIPIQFKVTTLSETPVTYFTVNTSIPLPSGLFITDTGMLQGTPLVATTTGYLSFSATNGFTLASPAVDQFTYSTKADAFNLLSNSVVISAGSTVSIPLQYTMPSGLNNAVMSTLDFLSGLSITANTLTGTFSNGIWPNFIFQQPLFPRINATSTVGGLTSVSSTRIVFNGSNLQGITRYIVGLNAGGSQYTVYSASNSFNFRSVLTGNASGYVDMKPFKSGALGANCKYTITSGSANGLYGNSNSFITTPLLNGSVASTVISRGVQRAISIVLPAVGNGIPLRYTLGINDALETSSGLWLSNQVATRSNGSYVFRWLPQYTDEGLSYGGGAPTFTVLLLGGVGSPTGLQYRYITIDYGYDGFTIYPLSNTSCTLTTINDVETHGYPVVVAVGSNVSGSTIQFSSVRMAGMKTGIGNVSGNTVTLTSGGPFTVGDKIFGGGMYASGGGSSFPFHTILAASHPNYTVSVTSFYNRTGATFFATTDVLSPGTDWSNATNGFTLSGSNVAWGGYSNASGNQSLGWIATGLNTGSVPAVKYSSDAQTWIDIPFGFPVGTRVGPVQFDGCFWNILVGSGGLVRHDLNMSTIADFSTWKILSITFEGGFPSSIASFPIPAYDTVPTIPISATFSTTPTGPTFTLPTSTTYLVLQYVPITPVLFDAYTSDPTSIYYLGTSNLPPGMVWSPRTLSSNGQYYIGSISGLSVTVGTYPIEVYAKNDAGSTKLTVTFVVSRPFPTLTHGTGSAYTAFVRSKVETDAATNAVNNRVHPWMVGQFLLDRPPDEVIADPICSQPDITQQQRLRDASAAAQQEATALVLGYRSTAQTAAAVAASTSSISVAQAAADTAASASVSASALASKYFMDSTIVNAARQTADYAAEAAARVVFLQGQKSAWATPGRQAVVTTIAGQLGANGQIDGGVNLTWPLYNSYTFGTAARFYTPRFSTLMPDGSNVICLSSSKNNNYYNIVATNVFQRTTAFLTTISNSLIDFNSITCIAAYSSSNILLPSVSNISNFNLSTGSLTSIATGFSSVKGMVVGSNSNVYVSDNSRIYVVYPGLSTPTVLAGTLPISIVSTSSFISVILSGQTQVFNWSSNPGISSPTVRVSTIPSVDGGILTVLAAFPSSIVLSNATANAINFFNYSNYLISEVSQSTDGIGTAARFNAPGGIAITGSGSLVVSDSTSLIRLITPSAGNTIWTTSTIVSGLSYLIPSSIGVLPLSNTVVFSHGTPQTTNGGLQLRFATRQSNGTWSVSLEAGQVSGTGTIGIDGIGTSAIFDYITGISVIPSTGQIAIIDQISHAVRLVSPSI
jgi:hypothetical protein